MITRAEAIREWEARSDKSPEGEDEFYRETNWMVLPNGELTFVLVGVKTIAEPSGKAV